jgi:hypothetical protein
VYLKAQLFLPKLLQTASAPLRVFFLENLRKSILIIITRNQVPFQLQRLSLIPVRHSPRVKTILLFSQGIHSGLAFSGTAAGPIVWFEILKSFSDWIRGLDISPGALLTIFELDSRLQPQPSVIRPTVQLPN